jgi:broad specificity phosphatase PhoE
MEPPSTIATAPSDVPSSISTSYIGVGVAREYSEEYSLQVDTRSIKSNLQRSVSVNDLETHLSHVSFNGPLRKAIGIRPTPKHRHFSPSSSISNLPALSRARTFEEQEILAAEDEDEQQPQSVPLASTHSAPVSPSSESNVSPTSDKKSPNVDIGFDVSSVLPPASAGSASGFPSTTFHPPAPPTSSGAKSRSGSDTLSLIDAAVGIPTSVSTTSSSLLLHQTPLSFIPQSSSSSTILNSVEASIKRDGRLILAMVGLPARGKTFMARRLKRHISWMGYRCEIYNVGNYRRKFLGANQPAMFFDPLNAEGEAARRYVAEMAFDEMISSMATPNDPIEIAIFDATNTTIARRAWLRNTLDNRSQSLGVKFQLLFIESICNDEEIIKANVRETKLKSPDYKDTPEHAAVTDFLSRIQYYASVYQTISDEKEREVPYIKLIDVGRQIIANNIKGPLNSKIMNFLQGLHITPRPIWLTRHGESEFNVQSRIGGDSILSPRGFAYSLRLAAFINKLYPKSSHSNNANEELIVWTSTLKRTQLTANPIGRDIIAFKELDEIDAGICDGMSYEQIATTMPEEYSARSKNKFTYRYPRGESYQDIAHRLEPVMIELMRQKEPVLIVSHQATLRVLYAYLTDKSPETCPDILLPLHTIIQLTPKAYGCEEIRHEIM